MRRSPPIGCRDRSATSSNQSWRRFARVGRLRAAVHPDQARLRSQPWPGACHLPSSARPGSRPDGLRSHRHRRVVCRVVRAVQGRPGSAAPHLSRGPRLVRRRRTPAGCARAGASGGATDRSAPSLAQRGAARRSRTLSASESRCGRTASRWPAGTRRWAGWPGAAAGDLRRASDPPG